MSEAAAATYEHLPAAEPAPRRCTNCGAEGVDVFCPRCGEKQPDHHDLAVGHLAHEAVHELAHLDSKLFSTLRALLFRPGFLTAEYFAGRKKRYIAPLRLFLTLFALQIVAFSVYKPAALYSIDAFLDIERTGRMERTLRDIATKRGLPFETFKERLDEKWHKAITWLQLGNILGLAIVMKILQRRRFLAEHLVFAAHLLAFWYLLSLVTWPFYAVYGVRLETVQWLISFGVTVVVLLYGYFALRRFYASSRRRALLETAVLYAGVNAVTLFFMTAGLVIALATIH